MIITFDWKTLYKVKLAERKAAKILGVAQTFLRIIPNNSIAFETAKPDTYGLVHGISGPYVTTVLDEFWNSNRQFWMKNGVRIK